MRNRRCWICLMCKCKFLCDTNDCETCNIGSCVDRCPLYNSCLECDGDGNCVSECNPNQCCHENSCVTKCNPDGVNMCTWTVPPVDDPFCVMIYEGEPRCMNPGALCWWVPVSGPDFHAQCSPCWECELDSTYCVLLKPKLCKDTLSLFPPWYDCECEGEPDMYTPVPAGWRNICP